MFPIRRLFYNLGDNYYYTAYISFNISFCLVSGIRFCLVTCLHASTFLSRHFRAIKKYQLAATSPARPTIRSLSTQTRSINSPSPLKTITSRRYARCAPPMPIPILRRSFSKFRPKSRARAAHHAPTRAHHRWLTRGAPRSMMLSPCARKGIGGIFNEFYSNKMHARSITTFAWEI